VSIFPHHGAYWIYYRQDGRPVRRKAGSSLPEAEQLAAQLNAQLATGAPTLFAFTPVGVPELRRQFLDFHEFTLKSSLATVLRYCAATFHLERFVQGLARPPLAHQVQPDAFAAYLRTVRVAPNGHPNAARRHLRDKGIRFVLETCRAMFAFAGRRRHLPPYAGNPFAELPLDRLRVEDAKPIYVFDAVTELAFFRAADHWAFPIHFLLAKTGLRTGELVHMLIEDTDLSSGWLRVRNKPALGWRVKTGLERAVPLVPEAVVVLRRVIGGRSAGPVFLRRRFTHGGTRPLVGDRVFLERHCQERQRAAAPPRSRAELARLARSVWRDAGALRADAVRTSFLRIMRVIGLPEVTCPKSWRHTFATLLQDANVDPVVRQLTLGHRPTAGALGMTAHYTHTRPETQKDQIERALRLWPQSLEHARQWAGAGDS
jgi:integrase